MSKKLLPLSLAFSMAFGLSFYSPQNAQAKNDNWTIKTKTGDEVTVRDGWFVRGKKVVKSEKLGTLYEKNNGLFSSESKVNLPGTKIASKKGWFGRQKKEVSVLGNVYTSREGLFGSKTTEVKTIFGDSIKTKKGWFGRTTTEVEPGGLTGMLGSLIGFSVDKN